MLKILFVINAAITGGAERHTAALAEDLAREGFGTTVFALRAGTEGTGPGSRLLEPAQPTSFWRRSGELARLMDAEGFDVVVAVNQRPLALVAAARARAASRPAVAVVFHTTELRNAKEQAMQLGYNPLFNRADLVVFVSENQRRHWMGRGMRPRRALTILNGVDRARYAPPSPSERAAARGALGFSADDYVLGCSAMLRAEKNHGQLLEATALLRRDGVPARCLLVGDGPELPRVKQRADRLGIADHVVSDGRQKEVRRFIAAFDVGVLCSTAVETLSLSALETMSMGIPMVMSDIGGASEIMEGTGGRTFPVGDTDALTALLRALADRPHRAALGAASRDKVERDFDVSGMTARYADAFRTLAGERGKARAR